MNHVAAFAVPGDRSTLDINMLPRRSPRFHKNITSDALRNSSSQYPKDVSNLVNVNEDFRPLLWQRSIPGLSENEVTFPIPQPAPNPNTALRDQRPKSAGSGDAIVAPQGGSQVAIGVNWRVLRR